MNNPILRMVEIVLAVGVSAGGLIWAVQNIIPRLERQENISATLSGEIIGLKKDVEFIRRSVERQETILERLSVGGRYERFPRD
jgi:hypothetical protein